MIPLALRNVMFWEIKFISSLLFGLVDFRVTCQPFFSLDALPVLSHLCFSHDYHISFSSSNICIICLTYLETQFTSQVWVLDAYSWALTWVTEPSMFWQQSALLTSSSCTILMSIKDNIFLYDLSTCGGSLALCWKQKMMSNKWHEQAMVLLIMYFRKLKI